MSPEADAAHRERVKSTYRAWCQQHAARLATLHPRVADDVRLTRWRWLDQRIDRPMDARGIAECAQRAISRERVRRHGALDPDTAAAQHAAIRADWGIA